MPSGKHRKAKLTLEPKAAEERPLQDDNPVPSAPPAQEPEHTPIIEAHEEGAQAVGIQPQFTPAPTSHPVKSVRAGALLNQWLCPNGHVLGIVMREKHNDKTYPRLIKFPFAFLATEYVPENLIISKIDAGEIGCTRCGKSREWIPGQWMMDKLLKGRKR